MKIELNETEANAICKLVLAAIDNTLEERKIVSCASNTFEFEAFLDIFCKIRGMKVRNAQT